MFKIVFYFTIGILLTLVASISSISSNTCFDCMFAQNSFDVITMLFVISAMLPLLYCITSLCHEDVTNNLNQYDERDLALHEAVDFPESMEPPPFVSPPLLSIHF